MPLVPRRYPFRALDAAHHEVVVAGAGPVGLAAALGLARRGVRVTVLEDDDRVCEGSRAICLSRHSLEVLDRLGVGAAVESQALPWTTGRSYYRHTEVLTFDMPHSDLDPHPPMVNISQSALEQILVDAIERTPGVTIAWQHRVSFAADDGDYVTLTVSTPDGRSDLTADWAVATDGARSIVRQCLGLRLEGTSYTGKYLIADIHWRAGLPAERRVWFDPPASPGRTVILHRQPGDIWRFDCQLPPDASPSAELDPERVRARVAQHLDWLGNTEPWSLEWASVYSARAMSLDSYVHGRVVFAGDAAHQVPIFGVRGLNSGLEDAETLAWTLAAVVRCGADPGLLGAYSAERRDAWRQNIAQADLSTVFMSPGTHGYRQARDAVLALAGTRPELRTLINPRQTSATHARTSPLTIPPERDAGGDTTRLMPGDPVPDVPLPARGRSRGLHAERGPDFTLLAFAAGDADRLTAAATELADRLSPAAGVRVLVAPDAADALGAVGGELFVVRPDGLLLGRFDGPAALAGLGDHILRGGAARAQAVAPSGGTEEASTADPAEHAWRSLGEALDAVPAGAREFFLTKLVLLLALEQADPSVLSASIAEARG